MAEISSKELKKLADVDKLIYKRLEKKNDEKDSND
jgi:hypothetical protein|tara:strand:- start:274 stop:378 length:105 start_codon:yes stop_codon:yes gene_type:complete